MRVYILSFTKNGGIIKSRLMELFKSDEVLGFSFNRRNENTNDDLKGLNFGKEKIEEYKDKLEEKKELISTGILENDIEELKNPKKASEAVLSAFNDGDALIFIGAVGIAVRLIAGHIKNKKEDIPVIVIDELGGFVIPILSGHIGGANALARRLSKLLRAQCVITTSTDLNNVFAVDEWAKNNSITLIPFELAKTLSATLIDGGQAGINSIFPLKNIPSGLIEDKREISLGLNISVYNDKPFLNTLMAVPKIVFLGIGLKRGIDKAAILDAVKTALENENIACESIAGIGSISLKKDEEGLLGFAEELGEPISFFPPQKLRDVKGISNRSDFVLSVTGSPSVSEAAAIYLAGEGGRLIMKRQIKNGVTVAAAIKNWSVDFG